jgi:hypothetical protein
MFFSQWNLGLKIIACTWAVTSTWSRLTALESIALILYSLRHAFLRWMTNRLLDIERSKNTSLAVYILFLSVFCTFNHTFCHSLQSRFDPREHCSFSFLFCLGPWIHRQSISFGHAVTISNPNLPTTVNSCIHQVYWSKIPVCFKNISDNSTTIFMLLIPPKSELHT